MTDTTRTIAALLTLHADNATGAITPQVVRDNIVTFAGRTAVSVTDYGAKGDGATDDTDAINNAINAAATADGGLVVFPMPTVAYLVSGTIFANVSTGSRHVSLLGLGQVKLVCTPNLATNFQQYLASYGVIAISPVNNLAYPAQFIENLTVTFAGTQAIGNGAPIAAFTMTGNKHTIRHCKSIGAPVHGFIIRSFVTNNWAENCSFQHCMAHGSAQYNFAAIIEDAITNVFITECSFEYCTSRTPGIGALLIRQRNTQGGNYKISNLTFWKCELDSAGGSSINSVNVQQDSSIAANIIENIVFEDLVIEDTSNAHTGYAIGFPGAGTASIGLSASRVIYYGQASGALPVGVSKPSNVTYGVIDFRANGNSATNFLLPRLATQDLNTGSIANSGTSTLFTAGLSQVYRVVVFDNAGTNVNGDWTVLGTGQIKAGFAATGCTLTFSGANVVLTNTSGGSISFVGTLQVLR